MASLSLKIHSVKVSFHVQLSNPQISKMYNLHSFLLTWCQAVLVDFTQLFYLVVTQTLGRRYYYPDMRK